MEIDIIAAKSKILLQLDLDIMAVLSTNQYSFEGMTKKVVSSDLHVIHLAQLCCKNRELPVDQIQTVFLGIPFSLVYVLLQTPA